MGNFWIDLQPLNTEGQTKGYKLTQVSIPFGVGAKMNIKPGTKKKLKRRKNSFLMIISITRRRLKVELNI